MRKLLWSVMALFLVVGFSGAADASSRSSSTKRQSTKTLKSSKRGSAKKQAHASNQRARTAKKG